MHRRAGLDGGVLPRPRHRSRHLRQGRRRSRRRRPTSSRRAGTPVCRERGAHRDDRPRAVARARAACRGRCRPARARHRNRRLRLGVPHARGRDRRRRRVDPSGMRSGVGLGVLVGGRGRHDRPDHRGPAGRDVRRFARRRSRSARSAVPKPFAMFVSSHSAANITSSFRHERTSCAGSYIPFPIPSSRSSVCTSLGGSTATCTSGRTPCSRSHARATNGAASRCATCVRRLPSRGSGGSRTGTGASASTR